MAETLNDDILAEVETQPVGIHAVGQAVRGSTGSGPAHSVYSDVETACPVVVPQRTALSSFSGSADVYIAICTRSLRVWFRGEPEAVLELFDDIASWAYGYVLRCTRSKEQAIPAIRRAFVHVCQHPEVFADQRLPARSRMFLQISHHVVLGRRPSPVISQAVAPPALITSSVLIQHHGPYP